MKIGASTLAGINGHSARQRLPHEVGPALRQFPFARCQEQDVPLRHLDLYPHLQAA